MSQTLIQTLLTDLFVFFSGMFAAYVILIKLIGRISAEVIQRLIEDGFIAAGRHYTFEQKDEEKKSEDDHAV